MRSWKDKVQELLADPIASLLLRRDGLDRDQMIRDMEAAAARLRRQRPAGNYEAEATCADCESG